MSENKLNIFFNALTAMLGIAASINIPVNASKPKARKHTSQVQGDKASLLLAQQKRERKNALRLLHIVE